MWESRFFHSVTFSPTLPPSVADLFIERPQPGGPPILALNPRVFEPAKPTATYDPAQYYNSASSTLYFRPAIAGSFQLNSTPADTQSGVAQVA